MNQTFSFIRFGRLICTYFVDNKGQLVSSLALLIGMMIMAAWVFYSAYPMYVDNNRNMPFYFLGWAAWYTFTWQQTEILNHKERAIPYLLRPASQFEKIVLLWLVSGVLFLLVYLLLFTLVDAVGVWLVNNREWPVADRRNIGSFQLEPFFVSAFYKTSKNVWVFSALLHPFALAFLLLIRRYSFPLVAVLAFTLIAVGYFLNAFILNKLTDSVSDSHTPFDSFQAFSGPIQGNNTDGRRVNLPQPVGNQIRYLIGITVIMLLYITAYFRLKEREV